MALNDLEHPEYARAAQDVDELPQRTSIGEFHGGRGGAGNVIREADLEAERVREEGEKKKLAEEVQKKKEEEGADGAKKDYRGWADRGKDLLKRKFGGSK